VSVYQRDAVFDGDGRLVYKCYGHRCETDVIALAPGKYIVVAHVGRVQKKGAGHHRGRPDDDRGPPVLI